MLNQTALSHAVALADHRTRICNPNHTYPVHRTPRSAGWRIPAQSPVKQRSETLQHSDAHTNFPDVDFGEAESLSERIGMKGCPHMLREFSVKRCRLLTRCLPSAGSNSGASTSEWLCDALAELVQSDSQFFDWKWGAKIHYRY